MPRHRFAVIVVAGCVITGILVFCALRTLRESSRGAVVLTEGGESVRVNVDASSVGCGVTRFGPVEVEEREPRLIVSLSSKRAACVTANSGLGYWFVEYEYKLCDCDLVAEKGHQDGTDYIGVRIDGNAHRQGCGMMFVKKGSGGWKVNGFENGSVPFDEEDVSRLLRRCPSYRAWLDGARMRVALAAVERALQNVRWHKCAGERFNALSSWVRAAERQRLDSGPNKLDMWEARQLWYRTRASYAWLAQELGRIMCEESSTTEPFGSK